MFDKDIKNNKDIDDVDRHIINSLQGDFPLSPRPYAEAAAKVGITEEVLLQRLQAMLEKRVLTRFGPMFQIERMGGAFVLAAMQVPEEIYKKIAGIVNSFTEVAHNYRREHTLNMWFVLATGTPQEIGTTITRIENATGLPVFPFPKEREYFVEMKLPVLA